VRLETSRSRDTGGVGLERVMNYCKNNAVHYVGNQALSLGWHIRHEERELITRAM
jgi:hypothetical protein